jgi:hypothetical protein
MLRDKLGVTTSESLPTDPPGVMTSRVSVSVCPLKIL